MGPLLTGEKFSLYRLFRISFKKRESKHVCLSIEGRPPTCDLDLDPMTFIQELNTCAFKMCKNVPADQKRTF